MTVKQIMAELQAMGNEGIKKILLEMGYSSDKIIFSEEQKNTTVKVVDVTGREIRNYESGISNERSITIDMNGFAKGIYFVRIEDSTKNVVNRKIVKE